jgi:3-phenylpropionate/trans-cinnamate dioxygenase ferredoxin reductase subunit
MSERDGGKAEVVIVGGGAAGDAAAMTLRKAGFDGRIVLVSADRHPAYHRPYLSKEFLRNELPEERVFLRRPEGYEAQHIEWWGERRVVAADRQASSITFDDGSSLRFGTLVLATGGSPRWLPGVPRLSNVRVLRTLDDSVELKQLLAGSRRMLVIGAGFIGAEVAASARTQGKDVLLVEVASVPLGRALGEEMGQVYARIHRDHGIDLRTATSVTRWHTRGDRVEAVELSDGTREEVDAVLVSVGIEPGIALAQDLGLPLGSGGVLVDEMLAAEPAVYCAGDIAAHLHPLYGRHLRVEHWQVARRQGEAIGKTIAGQGGALEELPWFWSDQYDVKLQYLGNAARFDTAVWRGDREGDRFSVFYLNDGLIEAVLTVNDARTIRFSRELIQRRRPVDPDLLRSESADLRELARA